MFSNKKKLLESLYLLLLLTAAACIIKIIFSWDTTSRVISRYMSTLSPFIIGFFIAYLLNPMVRILDQKLFLGVFHISSRKVRGALSILITYMITLGCIIQILIYIIPQTVSSIIDLANQVQGWSRQFYLYLYNLDTNHPEWDLTFLRTFVSEYIPQYMDFSSLTTKLTTMLSSLVPTLFSTSMSVIKALLNIVIAFMVSCYMLIDKQTLGSALKRTLYAIMDEKKADSFMETAQQCNLIFSRFISGKTIDSIIIGVLCFIAMTIAELPYALLISGIVGVTNMIPYFGPFIGAVPGGIIIFLISPVKCLIYLIIVFVLQQFDGLILGPKILGESTGLRPVWIIFAISFGGAVAGIIGMFLGVPTVAVIGYLIDKWVSARLDDRNIPEEKRSLGTPEQRDRPKRHFLSKQKKQEDTSSH